MAEKKTGAGGDSTSLSTEFEGSVDVADLLRRAIGKVDGMLAQSDEVQEHLLALERSMDRAYLLARSAGGQNEGHRPSGPGQYLAETYRPVGGLNRRYRMS